MAFINILNFPFFFLFLFYGGKSILLLNGVGREGRVVLRDGKMVMNKFKDGRKENEWKKNFYIYVN